MKNKLIAQSFAAFFFLSSGVASAQSLFSRYPTSNRDFVVTLGTTSRCAVSNNTDSAVQVKSITFTYRCDGRLGSATRDARMTVFPGSYRNIEVLPEQICGLVEPISCSASVD